MSAILTAPALMSELSRRGVILRTDGDGLSYDAPRGAVADLLPDLQRFKPVLLELLAQRVNVACDSSDELGQRIEGAFNRGFDAEEVAIYNRAVFALNSQTESEPIE